MQIVTMFLALIGSLLAFILQPSYGLTIYLIGLFCYPQPLTLQIGTIDFSLSRILILPLLANIIFRTKLFSEFKWKLMDTFIVVYFISRLIAISHNVPINTFLERESGIIIFNLILPYFAVRLIINSKKELITFIKALVIIAVPLALLGAYQSITGNNPIGFMTQYYSWGLGEGGGRIDMRHGFYRASVTLGIHIIFGLFFAGVAPLCLSIWNQKVWSKRKLGILFGFSMLGLLSSMSSAPIFSIVISITVLSFYPFRKYWPVLVAFILISIVFLDFYSNNRWYHVPIRFAFSGANAHYRIGLIEEAFGGGMTGHWIAGYGYVGAGPGNDNTNFNWFHRDFVNIYIAILARYGLLGLLPFLCINFLYYRNLYISGSRAPTREDLWLVWCIMSVLIGWNISMMTVSAMGQVNTFLFMLIGISNNLPKILLIGPNSGDLNS